MTRTLKKFFYNVSSERVVVTIRSDFCEKDSVEARRALAEIFTNFVNSPEFLFCDSRLFEKATLSHDGHQWIFVGEAIVPKEME